MSTVTDPTASFQIGYSIYSEQKFSDPKDNSLIYLWIQAVDRVNKQIHVRVIYSTGIFLGYFRNTRAVHTCVYVSSDQLSHRFEFEPRPAEEHYFWIEVSRSTGEISVLHAHACAHC